jgi:uncharacterized protein
MPTTMRYILVVTCLSLVSVPVFAASFDCKKAKTDMETLICKNPDLNEVDGRLGDAFNEAIDSAANKKEEQQVKQGQLAWLKKRDAAWGTKKGKCYQNIACLVSMYEERIAELSSGD